MYRIAIALIAFIAISAPASAATIDAHPGGLQTAFNAARAGDSIVVRGVQSGVVNAPATATSIRLFAAEGSVLKALTINGGRDLDFDGFDIRGMTVNRSPGLAIRNSRFTEFGVFLNFVDGLSLDGNRINDARDGFVIDDSADFSVTNNECTRVPVLSRPQSGDCIQMARTKRFVISGNYFHDQPSKPHVDAIEITDNNYDGVIERNRFVNVRGIIFTPGDNTPIRSQYRMTVVNNLFSRTREMAFNGVRMVDSKFIYNTAFDGGYVQIGGASSGNTVVGNLMKQFRVDPSRQKTYVPTQGWNVIASLRAGMKKVATDVTGVPKVVNAAAGDYHLLDTSLGANIVGPLRPATDLLGDPWRNPGVGALAR